MSLTKAVSLACWISALVCLFQVVALHRPAWGFAFAGWYGACAVVAWMFDMRMRETV